MKEGNIILAALKQSDGKYKQRPALILRELPKYGELVVCGISTQFYELIPDFDEIVGVEDPDFITSGLNGKSLIRLAFLSVIPRKEVIGSIGEIDVDRHYRLLSNLSNYLKPKTQN